MLLSVYPCEYEGCEELVQQGVKYCIFHDENYLSGNYDRHKEEVGTKFRMKLSRGHLNYKGYNLPDVSFDKREFSDPLDFTAAFFFKQISVELLLQDQISVELLLQDQISVELLLQDQILVELLFTNHQILVELQLQKQISVELTLMEQISKMLLLQKRLIFLILNFKLQIFLKPSFSMKFVFPDQKSPLKMKPCSDTQFLNNHTRHYLM